jgi:hypothetical protein
MTANRHFTTILSADVPQQKGPRKANLDKRLDTYRAPPLALYALYPPTRNLGAKVRLFIDFQVKRFEVDAVSCPCTIWKRCPPSSTSPMAGR